MVKTVERFLLVDDDPLNNTLSKIVLKRYLGEVEVTDFVMPEEAIEYIKSEFEDKLFEEKTTLFLDINMPSMSGWEFLEIFKTFKEPIQKQFNIYMLSSSIDESDIKRAKDNPLVINFIEKPLNKAIIKRLFG